MTTSTETLRKGFLFNRIVFLYVTLFFNVLFSLLYPRFMVNKWEMFSSVVTYIW